MDPEVTTISEIIDYPIDTNGDIVTRRKGLGLIKPRLNAPPPDQPGSVDWTMTHLFGSTSKAIEMIESLVAGQGENADAKWVKFVILYRQWEIEHKRGELVDKPTLNQVCYSLDFDATQFVRELQVGVMTLMKSMGQFKMAMASQDVLQNLKEKAINPEADVKEIELALKIGGIIDEKGGPNIQINNSNNQATLLKGEKDRMKSPLLQFRETVVEIDDEVRREE